MKEIAAVIRVKLGRVHDATEITPEDVVKLLKVVPLELQEVQPLTVTYHDVDSQLIIHEHHFQEGTDE